MSYCYPGMRVFRQLGDVGMVWSLQSLKDLEDPLLLSGHLAMFLNEFNLAQVGQYIVSVFH